MLKNKRVTVFTNWLVRIPSQAPYEPIIADGRVFFANYYSIYCIGEYFPPVTYYYKVTPPGAGGQSFTIKLVIANATPSNTITTQLLVSQQKINYTATGIDGTLGMSNITLPNQMLGGPLIVRVNNAYIPSATTTPINATHTSIYFTYSQSIINYIDITGTTSVPEFSSTIILPLLMAMSLVAVAFAKKKLPKI